MKRQEQKEYRKQEILYAALDLFVKKGYAATKITDIAEKVSMSVGLLFHYFESKEKLYEEALVIMCNPKTKALLLETKEFKNAVNLYIVTFEVVPENTVYSIEEPILKKQYIELAVHQQEKERIKRQKEAKKNDQTG